MSERAREREKKKMVMRLRPHKNVFGNSTNENSRCEYSSKRERERKKRRWWCVWDHIKMSSETALMKTPAVNIQASERESKNYFKLKVDSISCKLSWAAAVVLLLLCRFFLQEEREREGKKFWHFKRRF
jgi:hypothetical protein